MLSAIEKTKLMNNLMLLGESKKLGFIELHDIVALILNGTIESEEDLKIIFNSATKDL